MGLYDFAHCYGKSLSLFTFFGYFFLGDQEICTTPFSPLLHSEGGGLVTQKSDDGGPGKPKNGRRNL